MLLPGLQILPAVWGCDNRAGAFVIVRVVSAFAGDVSPSSQPCGQQVPKRLCRDGSIFLCVFLLLVQNGANFVSSYLLYGSNIF